MCETMNSKIKDWYVAAYPTDELGMEIDGEVTFGRLFQQVLYGGNVYELLAGDSLVRERVFKKICLITGWAYDAVFELWIEDVVEKRIKLLRAMKHGVDTGL